MSPTSEKSDQKSEFVKFLGGLTSFTGDLSAITSPSFLLNGLSMTEYSAYYADHPAYFKSINCEDPTERLVNVVKWFISQLYGSYASRVPEKKPYNPILGEQYFATSEGLSLSVEQTSHHPPVTSFHLEGNNVNVTGQVKQKSSFKGTWIQVIPYGRLVLTTVDDIYLISLPQLALRGLFSGNVFIELMGQVKIVSKIGYSAHFEFIPKAWFSGQYHTFKVDLFNPEKELFANISGKWTEEVKIKFVNTSPPSNDRVLFDATQEKRTPVVNRPIEEQGPLETHHVWGKVTQALKDSNYTAANKFKSDIEEEQRRLRKERIEDWKPAHFEFIKDDANPELLELTKQMSRIWNIGARQEEEVDGVKVI
eukprot:NODE_88_length_21932_cov_0.317867.p6 type:complete len:366 gc:universal NODE_88_length_21932_cov_0.317867:20359-21456(+)